MVKVRDTSCIRLCRNVREERTQCNGEGLETAAATSTKADLGENKTPNAAPKAPL